jgi:hypothetical protein
MKSCTVVYEQNDEANVVTSSRTALLPQAGALGQEILLIPAAQWYLYDEVLHSGTGIYLKDETNVVIHFQDLGPAPLDKTGALDQEILQHSGI